jgi:hypothetical protein
MHAFSDEVPLVFHVQVAKKLLQTYSHPERLEQMHCSSSQFFSALMMVHEGVFRALITSRQGL